MSIEFSFASAVSRVKDAKELLKEKIETVAGLFWEYFKSKNPEKAEIVEKLLESIPIKVYSEKIYNDDYGVWATRLWFENANGVRDVYVASCSEYWDSDDEKVDGLDEPEAEALMSVYYQYPECAKTIETE